MFPNVLPSWGDELRMHSNAMALQDPPAPASAWRRCVDFSLRVQIPRCPPLRQVQAAGALPVAWAGPSWTGP